MRIGFMEIFVIFVVALLVIGPDKFPEYCRKFGQALRGFREVTNEATKDIRENIVEPLNEAQAPLREALEPINELQKDINDNVNGIKKDLTQLSKAPTAKKPAAEKKAAAETEEVKTEPVKAEEPETAKTAGASAAETDVSGSEAIPAANTAETTETAPADAEVTEETK